MIRLCETFISLQGEGLTVGKPAFFIRTGKCSVGCRFCDTKYSWNSYRLTPVEELAEKATEQPLKTVIITGGEPLEEVQLPELIEKILLAGKEVIVESCGHKFRGDIPKEALLVLSPKPPSMGAPFPYEEVESFLKNYPLVQLKFTLYDEQDLNYVLNFMESRQALLPQEVVFQPLEVPN
jgi:7-carboxy-7-deazaguanine synthase